MSGREKQGNAMSDRERQGKAGEGWARQEDQRRAGKTRQRGGKWSGEVKVVRKTMQGRGVEGRTGRGRQNRTRGV